MSETIEISDLSNAEFLKRYAAPGRIGLAGGSSLIDKAITRAQRHVHPEKLHSVWSHAFLFQGSRHDGHHWVFESDLQVHRKHIRLGVQENRAASYGDEAAFPSLAILDFSLNAEQISRVLAEALELVAARTRYSLREIAGTLLALRHPSLRKRENLLARERNFYCSAFVHHLFRTAGVDLAPGLDAKNTTPQDLWQTMVPHTRYVLKRGAAARKPSRLTALRQSVKNRLPGRSANRETK